MNHKQEIQPFEIHNATNHTLYVYPTADMRDGRLFMVLYIYDEAEGSDRVGFFEIPRTLSE